MAKFTFLEVHLDGAEFTNLTGGADETDVVASEDEPAADTEEGGPGKVAGAVVALVVLVAIAYAAKRFAGGSEGDVEDLEDLEDELPDAEA